MEDGTCSLTKLVGKAIHTRRKRIGISQEVLSERVGVGQQSLSRMEQGKIAPKFERLQLIADALECRVADLFMAEDAAAESYGTYFTDLVQPLSAEGRAFFLDQTTRLAHFLASQGKEPSSETTGSESRCCVNMRTK